MFYSSFPFIQCIKKKMSDVPEVPLAEAPVDEAPPAAEGEA